MCSSDLPDPRLEVNVTPKGVGEPYEYSQEIRRKIGDDRRWVRLYGSEVVVAHLTGEEKRARLHLVNYSRRPVRGLRVRLRGAWKLESHAVFGEDQAEAADFVHRDGGTEFTVAQMGPYAVTDLSQ